MYWNNNKKKPYITLGKFQIKLNLFRFLTSFYETKQKNLNHECTNLCQVIIDFNPTPRDYIFEIDKKTTENGKIKQQRNSFLLLLCLKFEFFFYFNAWYHFLLFFKKMKTFNNHNKKNTLINKPKILNGFIILCWLMSINRRYKYDGFQKMNMRSIQRSRPY